MNKHCQLLLLFACTLPLYLSGQYSLMVCFYHSDELFTTPPSALLKPLINNINHEQISDVHVMYNCSEETHNPAVLEALEKLPVTLHFYHGALPPSYYLRVLRTMCLSSQAIALSYSETLNPELKPEMVAQDLQVIRDCNPDPSAEHSNFNPRVSLITSLFKGDLFVSDFMKNMVEQTFFSEAELIIINADSPGQEESVILPYLKDYPNIRYIRLPYDPGLYAIWNRGIKFAQAPLVGNANLDDRRELHSLEYQTKVLEQYPQYDLVYCDFCLTYKPNQQWQDFSHYPRTSSPGFSKAAIRRCLPGPQPVWRKSMHETAGYFREDFISAADQEMWCRAVDCGSSFVKLNYITGLYYVNPEGISTCITDSQRNTQRNAENTYIAHTYKHLWT